MTFRVTPRENKMFYRGLNTAGCVRERWEDTIKIQVDSDVYWFDLTPDESLRVPNRSLNTSNAVVRMNRPPLNITISCYIVVNKHKREPVPSSMQLIISLIAYPCHNRQAGQHYRYFIRIFRS
jgi:hypothetical protein